MITKRLLALQLMLATLGGVYIVPPSTQQQQCGTNLALPEEIADWSGKDAEVTVRERGTLGSLTEFARKNYTSFWGDRALVSIVLSGPDMNQSIHRPERCLPTQNFTIHGSSACKVPLANSQTLTVTRLYVTHPAKLANGTEITVPSLIYYWFIGATRTTHSHYEREFLDIADGVVKGYHQRWAYVTVMMDITHNLTPADHTEKETDQMIQKLIAKVVPLVEKPEVANR